LARDEVVASSNFSFDVGQNLAPLIVKAQRTRRTNKPLALKVPEQIEDSRRP
jgi:hypothetical protein